MPSTVLITGATSGIGLAFAELFAENGHPLVIVARREEQLQQLAMKLEQEYQVQVYPLAQDLSERGSAEKVATELKRQDIAIEVLVNNAAFGTFGEFATTDMETELQEMELNMVTLTHLTKLLLPDMLQKRSGRILNVSSCAAFQPGPIMAVYFASKAYVLSFSEALAEELRGSGVSVTCLCPGLTKTNFQKRAGMEKSNMEKSRLRKLGIMDADTVARIGYEGMLRGKRIVIPGLKNKFFAFWVRFLPRGLVTRIVKKLR